MNTLHRKKFLPLLLSLLGCGMSAVAVAEQEDPAALVMTGLDNYEENIKAQWALWPYFDESIVWHTDWTRWYPNATVKEHFRAYRDLGPDVTKKFSTLHTNTYFYEDERGTVANCGAMCGPWELDKEDPRSSSPYGIIHPSRDYMRTINFQDRSLIWMPKDLPTAENPSRAGMELFLGDGEFLRVSIGIAYDAAGPLSQVSVLREDTRDFGLFWSGTDATPTAAPELTKHTTTQEKQSALDDFWFTDFPDDGAYGGLHVSVPGLEQSTTFDSSSLWLGNGMSLDTILPWDDITVFEVPDDGIVIVCPNRLPATDEDWFEVAVAWKKADGTWAAAIEAVYENGTMSHVDYITIPDNLAPAPAESAADADADVDVDVDVESVAADYDDSSASRNISLRWHGTLVAMSMVVMSMLA